MRAVSAGIAPIGSGWRLMADPSISRKARNHAPERVAVQFADSISVLLARQAQGFLARGRAAGDAQVHDVPAQAHEFGTVTLPPRAERGDVVLG
jgi:hypothetical protein